jgi:hypothetical protein
MEVAPLPILFLAKSQVQELQSCGFAVFDLKLDAVLI